MTRPESTPERPAGSSVGRVWDGIGSSMLPFVMPGSRLHLRPTAEPGTRPCEGDLICYLGAAGRIVAHRLVAIRREGGAPEYVVKGDAQSWTERVSPEAVLAIVERVEQPLLSYDTDGAVGRAIAQLAVSTPSLLSAAAAVARVTNRAAGQGWLRASLARALRAQRLLPGRADRLEAFLGAVALAALGPAELALLTNQLVAAGSSQRNRELFPWEARWLEADLPRAPARILVGGAGAGREVFQLASRGYGLVAFDPVDRLVERARESVGEDDAVSLLVGSYQDLADPGDAAARAFARRVERESPYDAVLLGWGSLTHVVEPRHRLGLLTRLRDLCPSGPVLASFWLKGERSARGADRARAWGTRLGAALRSGSAPTEPIDDADQVMAHAGFGHAFTRAELETLATTAGYAVTHFEANTTGASFPHATLQPTR